MLPSMRPPSTNHQTPGLSKDTLDMIERESLGVSPPKRTWNSTKSLRISQVALWQWKCIPEMVGVVLFVLSSGLHIKPTTEL